MIPVFIDLETYYSPTHSLTKMSPLAYCMHPDTEVISIAIKVGKCPTDVIFGEDKVKHALSRIDWSNKMVIGHNLSGFDGMILAWRLGVKPKAWGCTLAMARPFFAKTVGVSLKAVAKELGLGDKLDFDAVNAKGKHLCDFTPEELAKMEDYNRTDTELCAGIFNTLAPKLGVKELNLIDMTIRMLLEPAFVLDYDMLEDALVAEKRRKFEALMRIKDMLGVEDEEAARAMLASAPKFKAFLESQGVPVPMKISKTTEKPTPALAKTDEDFLALLECDNELVAAAAEARLGVKSTILETRIEAFITAGDAVNGLLPVPLHWAGADTTWRWCLAEGTQVLVKDDNGAVFTLPIEQVNINYELWDGIEWVRHCGVVFSGDKEVITWGGVTATPEHIVWVDEHTKVKLGYAMTNKLALWGGCDVHDLQVSVAVRRGLCRDDEARVEA